ALAAYTKTIGSSNFSQSFTFDYVGRATSMTYPDGSTVAYAYTDGGGNLYTLSLNGVIQATWSNYLATGEAQNVSYVNGVGTQFSYDAMEHLTSVVTMKGSSTLQNLTYDWYTRPQSNGLNLGSISDHRTNSDKIAGDGSNTDETQTFTYDALYRLTQ